MADVGGSIPEGEEEEEEEEVTAILKSVLEKQGVLGKLKAQIRSCVYQALDEGTAPKPQLSNDTLVMNELIREYLEYVYFTVIDIQQ
eukprot:TRINITY_DN1654_c0_g1_i3.p1 TRINITY_DN1654_c0_g1~~TRINITY_DN1654_c0_g1_i3.p1  ORF type:complete len:101 (+),score=23.57 TRINITY_DN1654_c0_g1_i3:45-305(+)